MDHGLSDTRNPNILFVQMREDIEKGVRAGGIVRGEGGGRNCAIDEWWCTG